MSFFEGSIVQASTAGTAVSVIWNPTNTSPTTFGSLGSIASGLTLNHIGIVNAGPGTIYVGGATVTSATGLPIPPGGQCGIQRYSFVPGVSSSSGTISAITASGTAQVQVGLVSITAVN